MLRFIQSWFAPGQPKTREQLRKEVMERREEIGRSVAERLVRGNVNIKAGRFLTKDDLDARREDQSIMNMVGKTRMMNQAIAIPGAAPPPRRGSPVSQRQAALEDRVRLLEADLRSLRREVALGRRPLIS